ncbi:hypothetical protein [Bradyrhizobium sp. USDA 4506]
MLPHPTLDLLQNLGLHGMAKGFKALDASPKRAVRGGDQRETPSASRVFGPVWRPGGAGASR